MEIINNLLLWLHLTALAAGAVPAFGMPVVGSKMRAATPETRAVLFSIAHGLSSVGRGVAAVTCGVAAGIVTDALLRSAGAATSPKE